MKDVRTMTDEELRDEEAQLLRRFDDIRHNIAYAPGDWFWPRCAEIAKELNRRLVQSARDAVWEEAAKMAEERDLEWTRHAIEHERTLVHGNLNRVAAALRARKGT